MFGDIVQPTHLLLILAVALIVLGPKRLPEVGRSLGRGLRDFRQGMAGIQEEAHGVFHDALDEPSEPPVDSAVSAVPEPLAPATAEPVVAAQVAPEPVVAGVTKVTPAEPAAPEFTD